VVSLGWSLETLLTEAFEKRVVKTIDSGENEEDPSRFENPANFVQRPHFVRDVLEHLVQKRRIE
jgi:hypothetical protein